MSGRSKFSKVIYVKPYSPSNTDNESEKENIGNNVPTTDSQSKDTMIFDPKDKYPTDKDESKMDHNIIRARSLERFPANNGTEHKEIERTRSFERNRGRSLGTPELAPVFTTSKITKNTDNNFNFRGTPVKRRANW